jgi:preprotein translocase subunit YajC
LDQAASSAAQAASPNAQGGGGMGGFLSNPMLPMLAILAVMYFVVIIPQSRKKQRAQQEMLAGLKKGDEVVTSGGLLGRISGVKDDEITLQVQEGVRIRVLRSSVTSVQKAPAAPEAAKADPKASTS